MISRRSVLLVALVALNALATSCGGGGGGGSSGSGSSGGGGSSGSGGSGGGGGTPPPPDLIITTTSLPNVVQGQPYNQSLQASGGTPPYIWTASQPTLPVGMTLSSAGVLSGTPQTATSSNNIIAFYVADSGSPQQSTNLQIHFAVSPLLSINSVPLPSGNIGVSYPPDPILSLRSTGGFGPYTWGLQSGSAPLPPGIALSSQGILSGLPGSSGNYNFTAQVTDVGPPQQTATQTFSLLIGNHIHITSTTLPVGVIGKSYQGTLQAVGGTPPYSWNVVQFQDLPTGLQIQASTGMVSGIPTQTWTFGSGFMVADSAVPPQTDYKNLPVPINPTLGFTQTTLPDGAVTQSYSTPVPFQGGVGPYTVQIVSGTLPPGIGVSNSGTNNVSLTGTPSTLGSSNFTLQVQDSESPPIVLQQAFSLRMNALLVFHGTAPAPAAVGLPYSYPFQAQGGLLPLHWSIPNPLFAFGLAIDPNSGVLSGTPGVPGTQSYTVSVTDSASPPQALNVFFPGFTVYDRLRIATSSLPRISPNTPTQIQLVGSGGAGKYSWSTSAGLLPQGLALSSSGILSGQATQTGQFPFTIRLQDDGPPSQVVDQSLLWAVSAGQGRNDSPVTATTLSNGTYNASISPLADPPTGVASPDHDYYRLAANAGSTVTIEIMAQRLSPPSPLDSVLEIVDSSNNPLSLCSSSPDNTSGPFTQPCVNDDLQQGISTDSKLILRVPNGNSGPLTFYAHVLDFRGDARPDMLYQIQVTNAEDPLRLSPVTLGLGVTRGVNYQQQLSSTGGSGSVTWSVSAGTLPPGWSLTSGGLLAGMPTTNGTYTFTITATDSATPINAVSLQYTLRVVDPVVITTSAIWPDACLGQPYSFVMQTTGGLPPFHWGSNSPSWPAGITLTPSDSTMVVGGTGNILGTFHSVIGMGDSTQAPNGMSQNITLNIVNCP